MKIMIDTNIIVSAILFPEGSISLLLKNIVKSHEIYISTFSIEELTLVFERKFKDKKAAIDNFLNELSYELVYTPVVIDRTKLPYIRDSKDYPILASAINADVDILLSSDKDFIGVDCKRPEILTPQLFKEKYL